MPTIILLPYLPLTQACAVGPWRLIPRRVFTVGDAADEAEADIIRQLFRLYQLERDPELFGCLARRSDDADVGEASIQPLHRAVLAALLEANPELDRRSGSL